MKKSQTAIEFLIVCGAVLLFFIIFFGVIESNISDKMKEKRSAALRDETLAVQREINFAYTSTDGYSRAFTIPQQVSGADWNISMNDQLLYARTIDEKDAISFSVPNITGQPKIGMNVIRKINGKTYLN
jgi:uncharacterized protein (UPF0333 family)